MFSAQITCFRIIIIVPLAICIIMWYLNLIFSKNPGIHDVPFINLETITTFEHAYFLYLNHNVLKLPRGTDMSFPI